MNDRFKFRAYDTDKKLMVYCWSEATEAQKNKYCEIYGKDESYYCWQSCELDCLGEFNNEYNHFIVEQCTGLKDKNGKLIYENDYVTHKGNIYKVFWNKTKISLENILNNDIIDIQEFDCMEVIGNEHEKGNIRKI